MSQIVLVQTKDEKIYEVQEHVLKLSPILKELLSLRTNSLEIVHLFQITSIEF